MANKMMKCSNKNDKEIDGYSGTIEVYPIRESFMQNTTRYVHLASVKLLHLFGLKLHFKYFDISF